MTIWLIPQISGNDGKSLESTPAVQMDNVGVSEAKPDNPYVLHSGDEIFLLATQ